MKLTIILIVCLSSIYLASSLEFETFQEKFGKKYTSPTEAVRRKVIYAKNLAVLNRHNSEYDKGLRSYKLSANKFLDKTYDEFIKFHTGRRSKGIVHLNAQSEIVHPKETLRNDPTLPASIDWREKGWVTPVKDQKDCGCCWAFSVAGAVEGQYFNKTGKLIDLSEQHLVDCNYNDKNGNWGCDGGLEETAFNYVRSFGLTTETNYKYKAAKNNRCFAKGSVIRTKPHKAIPVSELELQRAVATVGPISIAIYVDSTFPYYSGGVYSTENCLNGYNSLNHAVLLVGYGTDKTTGYDYWLVKNSWGPDWGENGYIRMRRNHNNMCGIATNGITAVWA